jgi:hypothetical protein
LRDGFREYYDPLTRQGLGARGFGWSTLLVELAPAPERALSSRHANREAEEDVQ